LQKERTRTSKGKIETIVLKIKYLLRELSGIIVRWEMKKILGTAAIMFGLATGDIDLLTSEYYGYYNPEVRFRYYENVGTASEPSFDAGQTSPFGLQAQTENAIIPTAADLDWYG